MAEDRNDQKPLEILENAKTSSLLYEDNNWSQNLLIQFDVLRQQCVFCDLTIITDGTQFRCHRFVLAAACPYFQALFRHDKNSCTKPELHLDFSADVFQLILDYIYTGKLEITPETIIDILEAADFLQFRDLVRSCCRLLLQHITDENAISLHQLAVAHLCQPLADATREYILSNFSAIMQTKDVPFLSPEVMRDFIANNKNLDFLPLQRKSPVTPKELLCQWDADNIEEQSSNILDGPGFPPCLGEGQTHKNTECQSDLPIDISRCLKHFHDHSKAAEVLVVVPREATGSNDMSAIRSKRHIFYYHPYFERWHILTTLPFHNRMLYSVTVLNNILYICGGEKKFDMPTRKVFAYATDSNRWLSDIELMIKPRSNHTAATAGGVLYIVGGRGFSDKDLWNNGESYDPRTGQWTLLPSIPGISGLARCCLVPLGEQLYVFGGMESYVSKAVQQCRVFTGACLFDMDQKQWTDCPALVSQLEKHNIKVGIGDAFAWRGFILIIDEDRRGKKMKLYNPISGTMTDYLRTNGQHRFGGYMLQSDVLYCTGGLVDLFDCHDLVHCRNLVENGEWNFLPPLPCPLSHHSCVTVSKILE